METVFTVIITVLLVGVGLLLACTDPTDPKDADRIARLRRYLSATKEDQYETTHKINYLASQKGSQAY